MKNLILLAVVTSLFGCASVAQNGALIGAYEAIANDDCAAAYTNLSNAERYKETTPALQAEITYLRSSCLEKEKKLDEALALYSYIVKRYPDSEYAFRAKARVEAVVAELTGPAEPKDEDKINISPAINL